MDIHEWMDIRLRQVEEKNSHLNGSFSYCIRNKKNSIDEYVTVKS